MHAVTLVVVHRRQRRIDRDRHEQDHDQGVGTIGTDFHHTPPRDGAASLPRFKSSV